MNFKGKIFILVAFSFFILLLGGSPSSVGDDIDDAYVLIHKTNESDMIGCCSIVLQLNGTDSIMSYRRDSNLDANVRIENVNWHGHNAIKQYKTENNYFCHVIITSDGWVIGLGGTDDGIDNQIAENITANMINDNNTISKADLQKIKKLKEPYGKGHVVIKAPDGNYGYATVDSLKIGKLIPGEFISIPNDYQYSRGDNLTVTVDDKVGAINNLSRSDLYGLDRREIITYDIHTSKNNNTTDIYASNEDGGLVGVNNSIYIDNIYVNGTFVNASGIPLAPDYKKIGSVTFKDENRTIDNLFHKLFLGQS